MVAKFWSASPGETWGTPPTCLHPRSIPPLVIHALGINQGEINTELSKALQLYPFLKQEQSLRDSLAPPSNCLDFIFF